jgi:hypothetical protein
MRQSHAVQRIEARVLPGSCATCGIPVDAGYFDDSRVVAAPPPGSEILLARFELPPQYCGVLQYFAQFTDAYADKPSEIATPGLQWMILINKRPLYPYINLDRIVNPWGNGSFEIAIRLDENATVDFIARRTTDEAQIAKVGGRILGRYWYNAAYGDVV